MTLLSVASSLIRLVFVWIYWLPALILTFFIGPIWHLLARPTIKAKKAQFCSSIQRICNLPPLSLLNEPNDGVKEQLSVKNFET
jgi:hypothetical protein